MSDKKLHCLFHNYSDYECSAETLIGIYLTQGDAETALLELIARAEVLEKKAQEFNQRYHDCHAQHHDKKLTAAGKKQDLWMKEYEGELSQITKEQRAWRMAEFGSDWQDIPDQNIDAYSFEEVEIGKVRQ